MLVNLSANGGAYAPVSHKTTIEFFDFQLIKSRAFVVHGELSYEPVLRDKGPILSMLSAHPLRLHLAWPVAYVARLHRRSSCIDGFRSARNKCLLRWQAQGTPDCILKHIVESTNYYIPYHECNNVKRKAPAGTSYLVLPFHPLWATSRLVAAVSDFSRVADHRILLQQAFGSLDPFLLMCSWRLSAPALGATLVDW